MKSDSVRVLLGLVVATALGLLIAAANDARLIRLADQLVPIGTLWVNAIRMTVIPLVVSLLVTGVASTTDVAAIGRLGARTLIVFVLLPAGIAVVMMPITAAVFSWLPQAASRPPLPPGASEAASQVVASEAPTLAGWLTSLIPSNPVSAAADGAMVPLIIFTMLFALALTRASASARNALLSLFHAVAETMLTLVGWVILAAPIGIFALILPLAAHAGSALVGGIGFYLVAYSMLSIVATLLLYPATAVFGGVSIRRFARAVRAAADCIQLELVDCITAGSGGERGDRALLAEAHDRIRAAAGCVDAEGRRTGVVDRRRAVHRLVLRHRLGDS